MIFHGYFRSSSAYRCRIAFNLKGLNPDFKSVHLRRDGGQQKSAAYMALNPQALVPALEVDDTVLTQSLSIIEWLDEAYPEPALLPAERNLRAKVRAFSQVIACDIHPLQNLRVLDYLKAEFHLDQSSLDRWCQRWIGDGLAACEALLQKGETRGDFCFGDTPAAELLAERNALPYRHCPNVVDYWAELPENKATKGRVLLPLGANETMSDGGKVAIETMSAAAERDGIEIRTSHRVQRVIRNEAGEIVGVEASTPKGTTRIRAKKAVIFVTGGFTHDAKFRRNYLHAPVFPGCGARSNEGDLIPIATGVGAQLQNMNYAWMCPAPLERILDEDPGLIGTFSSPGDSMIWVNTTGKRVANEKLAYNEMAQVFFHWDGATSSYPNLALVALWDDHSQKNCASGDYGRYIVPEGADGRHVIKADTLEDLQVAIAQRLEKYKAVTGGLSLHADFGANLKATIERFNGFARAGKDEDFKRGERKIEVQFNGPVGDDAGSNPTMFPISGKGPYYATLMTGATLDTKGGPVTTVDGHIIDDTGLPIPGLFGVGNCVASASGRSYWAGGATLGPILAFAHRAAAAANAEPTKAFTATAQAAE